MESKAAAQILAIAAFAAIAAAKSPISGNFVVLRCKLLPHCHSGERCRRIKGCVS